MSIVERLRNDKDVIDVIGGTELLNEAAAHIERLEAALIIFAESSDPFGWRPETHAAFEEFLENDPDKGNGGFRIKRPSREALGGEK